MKASLRLSQVELLAFLSASGIPLWPGLSTDPWKDVPEACRELLLHAGKLALLAHGLLPWGQGDETARAQFDFWTGIVMVCAAPSQRLGVFLTRDEQDPIMFYFCRANDDEVIHVARLPGIHDFLVEAHDMGWSFVLHQLGLEDEDATESDGQIEQWVVPLDRVEAIMQARRSGDEEHARKMLVEAGIPVEKSRALLRAWREAPLQAVLNFEYTERAPGELSIDRQITLFRESPTWWWVLDDRDMTATSSIIVRHLSDAALYPLLREAFEHYRIMESSADQSHVE